MTVMYGTDGSGVLYYVYCFQSHFVQLIEPIQPSESQLLVLGPYPWLDV